MTPATLPTVAVPTDNIPAGVSPIPVGSLAPDELTPNSPPRATPAGNVTARLNVPPPPTANDGGLTTQALDAGADDADASCSLTSQPRSSSAPAPKPKRKTDRRPTSFIQLLSRGHFYSHDSRPRLGTPAPRSSVGLDADEGRGSIPGFDLMHYVIRMIVTTCVAATQTRSARKCALSIPN